MSPPFRLHSSRGVPLVPALPTALRKPSARFAFLVLLLAPRLSLAAPAEVAAPSGITFTEADLDPVFNVAHILSSQPPCLTDGTDLAAASALARAASMLDVAARHYPPRTNPRSDPAAHARKRLVLVEQAVKLYERAYQCAPGHPQRHHLESALDLLDAARQLIVDTDRLPPAAPELKKLDTRRTELEARLPAPPPPPLPPDLPPTNNPVHTPEPEPEPPRFILRPELGIGTGTLTNVGNQSEKRSTSSFNGIYFQLTAATRFPLGARKIHSFMMGGVLGVQQVAPYPDFDGESSARSIVQGGLHLEFALHVHPRWFSFHPMVDMGAQNYVGIDKFGRTYTAPALGLCLDRELVCFNFRASLPLVRPAFQDATIFMGQFGLAVDLMRIVERRRGR